MGKYLVINIRSNIVSYCGFGLYLYYKYSIKCRTQICGQCQTLFYLSKLRFMRTIYTRTSQSHRLIQNTMCFINLNDCNKHHVSSSLYVYILV